MHMKRGNLIRIYNAIKEVKVGSLDTDCIYSLLKLKIELADPIKKIGEADQKAAEDLKPKDFKDGDKDSIMKWNIDYAQFMNKYMDEEVDINLPVLKESDIISICKENNLSLEDAESLMSLK